MPQKDSAETGSKNRSRVTPRRGLGSLERETGLEPATLSLGM
jgi:hypothetical protein